MDLATGAIGGIISKVAGLLKAEYNLQTGMKRQVESLTRELESAQAFLKEIDKVPPDQLNEQVKIWAYEVREASYDMEDVLDTFLVCSNSPKTIKNNKLKQLQEKIGSLFSKTKARHNIASAIEEVNKKLKEIDERRQRYKLDDRLVSLAPSPSRIDPRIALVHHANTKLLIGIDEQKDAIIKMLSQDDDMSSSNKTKVVSLLGFGGVGKTTLAKATYDQLKQEYECRAFVSVGQNPNLLRAFKDIIFHLGFKEIHSTQRGADLLIRELIEFLRGKRYLIVIDDIWETQSRRRIIEALTQNDIGSTIIITTRKLEVATGEVYSVQPLSMDNSIKLFYSRTFGGEEKCPAHQRQKVSETVNKILRRCGGVPLAIITMASLLVGKSMEEWLDVSNCIGFREKDKAQIDDTMWILSLSYHDLPAHLKTCLLHLSIFPEDYSIDKDALIWMWICEGFVKEKPEIGLFEIGEGYFNELINRSLIQPVEEKGSTIIEGCRVHDMILDLIRSMSHEANFSIVSDKLFGTNARRLALHNREVVDTRQDKHKDNERARSVITIWCTFHSQVPLQSFKLLRVLYIEACQLTQLGEHVGELHLLRCLVIRKVYDLMLPKEIGALKFLQVLYLADGARGSLPVSMRMLTQLVCLRAWGMSLPCRIIKELTSLQELQTHPGDDAKSIGQFVKDLGNLRELRVLRVFKHWTDERTQSDFMNSLGNLHKLQRLDLKNGIFSHAAWDTGMLRRIDPSSLANLSHLSLSSCSLGTRSLKILGGLPQLYYLHLSAWSGRATITGTAAHPYFQKLRSCLLPDSMVKFVVNEDENSSVSFTMWYRMDYPPAFGSETKQESCRSIAGAVMPNLEALYFGVSLMELTARNNGSCDNLGLEHLASLQKVTVDFSSSDVKADVVEKEKAALRHAIQVHPNRPTLQIR